MSSFSTERKTVSCSVFLHAAVVCIILVNQGTCQPTPTPQTSCSSYKSCDDCVPHAKCLWCISTNNCSDYPVAWLLPPSSLCPLAQARWGMCWMNFEALIITVAVICGIILLSITVCCCCCCCRKKRQSGPDRDEERFARKREEIRQRSEERKVERQARHDEIRRKYGLLGDRDHPYSKFENE
ncbi:uncharacterized protein V6R79_005876 [Siganus canaliculatus]